MSTLSAVLISIVVPTYNREAYIGKTIRSVLDQNYQHFELIIVDDGSTDNTEKVVTGFADSRIRYYRKSNEERAAARNYGVNRASGNYITFLDSDDLLKPNHLSEAIHFLKKNPGAEIFSLGYDIVRVDGSTLYPWKPLPDPVNNKLVEGNFLSCMGVFVQREILLQNPFNPDRDLSGSEDYELWIRLAARFPIRMHNVVTAMLVNHEARSVLQLDKVRFLKRITSANKYIQSDLQVAQFYGPKVKTIGSYLDLYAALHLAMAGYRKLAMRFLLKSIAQNPAAILNFRTLVVVKKILLR
ncbi:MAG TPA: glycosyltransferase [Ohtaekwangia sp.]|uniref:glycosyltransferase family 2 protein n=1 Tax=Ohtaekwangia sp. TaxID=2066019 RepID=UPI002F921C1C